MQSSKPADLPGAPVAVSNSANTQLESQLARLYRRSLHTIKLGLDAVSALLRELDNPQDAFLAVHVAGTNGKGSVSALLASVLHAAGFKVGLYTSPHLRRFNERVQINGETIPDSDLASAMDAVEQAVTRAQNKGSRDVTFFEFTTALAFLWFRRRGVQVAVLETGMGGRLDATNVVTPVVSVITSIGLDHQAYLGDTVEKIAGEKAGIIKPGRPVICGNLPAKAQAVISEIARQRGARIAVAADVCTITRKAQSFDGQRLTIETGGETIGRVTCPLLGRHQLGNIAVAIAALQEFARETRLAIADDAIRNGLARVRWPARLQVLSRDPVVLLDGAHNVEAMSTLCRAMEELREDRPVGVVASFLADKDALGCLRLLAPLLDRCWLVRREGERAMSAAALVSAADQAGLKAELRNLPEALNEAQEWARAVNGLVVVTGSLHMAGEVLELFQAAK